MLYAFRLRHSVFSCCAPCARPVPVCLVVALSVLILLAGCQTQSAAVIHKSGKPPAERVVRVDPCLDRTGFTGGRDLGAEATEALTSKVREGGVFEVKASAALMLTCDIERFATGSAIKRWVLPGWGQTQAGLTIMVWKMPEQEVLATFKSQSAVKGGGLYTLGADQYILDVAIDDIVRQLEAWAKGEPTKQERQ